MYCRYCLQLQALLADAVLEVLHQLLDAALDHGVGDLGLHAAHDLVDQVVLDLLVSLLLVVGLDALADGVLQLVEGVVLADVLGKVVVQLGQLLVLDLMQLDLEGGVLAGLAPQPGTPRGT